MLVLRQLLVGKISTAYVANASLIACTSDGASGADKSTSPISAAKLCVTGQTVMVMVVASRLREICRIELQWPNPCN